ncbi:4Fe-4S binding protein [Candidatus Alkanophaga liquidiphilum]|nr:Formate hydrogenlyase subunit 6/NADH:ubiquinone oxidoreductase 23 kD subunit [Candidatus Alkanophaga liquidiphilum]
MKLPYKIREFAEAVRSSLSSPYTVRYPFEPSPAPEGFRGKPQFDEAKCMGCGACVEGCPTGALTLTDEGNVRIIELFYGRCIMCGQCVERCPVEAIKLTTEYSIVYTAKEEALTSIRRTLVCCEICGTPITTLEHLKWITEKLGELALSNSTLVAVMQDLALGKTPTRAPKAKEIDRSDIIRVLCHKCRRRAMAVDHGWRAKY